MFQGFGGGWGMAIFSKLCSPGGVMLSKPNEGERHTQCICLCTASCLWSSDHRKTDGWWFGSNVYILSVAVILTCLFTLLHSFSSQPRNEFTSDLSFFKTEMGLKEIPKNIPHNAVEVLLSGNHITRLQADDFSRLFYCKSLSLSRNLISEIEPGAFNGLASLEYLSLVTNNLTELNPNIFEGLTSLKTLTVSDNSIHLVKKGAWSGLTGLVELFLFGNSFRALKTGMFEGLTTLEALTLTCNKISSMQCGTFVGLPKLKTLWLDDNRLSHLRFVSKSCAVSIKRAKRGFCNWRPRLSVRGVVRWWFSLLSKALGGGIQVFLGFFFVAAFASELQVGHALSKSKLPWSFYPKWFWNCVSICIVLFCTFNSKFSWSELFSFNFVCSDKAWATSPLTWEAFTSTSCRLRCSYEMFVGLDSLQRLAVHTNNLTAVQGGVLTGLLNLRILDLDDNFIHSIRPDSFRGLDNLTQVSPFCWWVTSTWRYTPTCTLWKKSWRGISFAFCREALHCGDRNCFGVLFKSVPVSKHSFESRRLCLVGEYFLNPKSRTRASLGGCRV